MEERVLWTSETTYIPLERHQLTGLGQQTEGRIFSQLFQTNQQGAELASPLDFKRLASEGFRINPIIYACIRLISQSVGDPELKALTHENDNIITNTIRENDSLSVLLHSPNDTQDQYDLFEQLLIHLMVTGNAFLRKVRSQSGQVVQLELIRPDIMGLIPGNTRAEGKIKTYTVRVDEVHFSIPTSDIIHFKLPDALDEFWGLSPIFVLARYGDIDLQSADFLRAYFLNRGVPAGILTFDHPVQKPERERVRDMWKEQYNAISGWHNVAVMDAKVTYQAIQSGIKDVDMQRITDQTETRICATFGVPPVIISALSGIDKASFANTGESRKLFWLDTMTPLFARLSRKLTKELAIKEFGIDRQIVFDLSGVAPLQENKAEIRKLAMQGWNTGLYTRNQAFSLLGQDIETNVGDVIKVLPGTEFIGVEEAVNSPKRDDAVPVSAGSPGGSVQSMTPEEVLLLKQLIRKWETTNG